MDVTPAPITRSTSAPSVPGARLGGPVVTASSFPEHANQIANELAHLVVSRSSATLDGRGLDLALSSRAAALELLRTVHHEVTSITREGTTEGTRTAARQRSVERLQAHPVATFARVLADHATPMPEHPAMTELAAAAATEHMQPADRTAEQGWAQVGRHAVLAADQWATRPPTVTAEQQWSAVADVAALAETIAMVDHHLLSAAQDAGHPLTGSLAAAADSGLQVAAREVLHLARSGPLPSWGAAGEDVRPQGVMLVTGPADVAAGHRRLAGQISTAVELSPRATAQLLTGQLRLLAAAAGALRDVDPARAQRAYELGGSLRSLPAVDRAVVSLAPGDRRAVHQTAELVQHLARAERSDPQLVAYRAALAAVVDQTPRVLAATADHVATSFRTGRWLVPDHDAQPGQPLWQRLPHANQLPQLSSRLHAVSARATASAAFPAPATAQAPAARPPHEVLRAVADLTRPAPARPTSPRHQPDPGVGRG